MQEHSFYQVRCWVAICSIYRTKGDNPCRLVVFNLCKTSRSVKFHVSSKNDINKASMNQSKEMINFYTKPKQTQHKFKCTYRMYSKDLFAKNKRITNICLIPRSKLKEPTGIHNKLIQQILCTFHSSIIDEDSAFPISWGTCYETLLSTC